MTPPESPRRCCPKCQSTSYLFRARKTVEEAEGKFVETKYRCRACAHQWWDRAPAPREVVAVPLLTPVSLIVVAVVISWVTSKPICWD